MKKRSICFLIVIIMFSQFYWLPSLNIKAEKISDSSSVHKLMPKYLVTNFNFDMTASTVTVDKDNFYVSGNFRTGKDLVGVKWETKDNYSHPDLKYPTKPDFSGVTLDYDYTIEGFTNLMDSGLAPSLTIETNNGETHYVRLWNYVINRPMESWELGATRDVGKDIRFPEKRKEGSANGSTGHIKIDFNNLYSGWTPYIYDMKQARYVPDPNWKKIPVNDIKSIMWSVVPKGYQSSGSEGLGKSEKFKVQFNNWKVSGDTFLMNDLKSAPNHNVRMTDDYDDIYNLTPERVVGDYKKLGYNKLVNFYIGASHYYDKSFTGSGVEMNTDYPFNQGFEEWYKNYAKRLKENNFELIQSISMESVDAPETWWQRTWDNIPGTTGWKPTPHLLSFTNDEVKSFYQKYTLGLAKIANDAGLTPMIQLGEPWWWHKEDIPGKPPCFYDQATKELFEKEKGYPMYEFRTSNEDFTGHEDVLEWLSDKNGEFSLMLRDTIKKTYSNAKFTVLFFTPSVIDKDRVPPMMSMVNFPKKQWKYPNLDFFMIEDYDYLIDNHMDKHKETLNFAQENLGYPSGKVHYFSGFVLNKDQQHVWKNINQAINDGFNQGLGEVYIWAYAQVIRDGWKTPDIINVNYPSGNYTSAIDITLNSKGADKIVYTTDGSEPSLKNGLQYSQPIKLNSNTVIKAIAIKNNNSGNVVSFDYKFINYNKLVEDSSLDINQESKELYYNFTPKKTGLYRIFTKSFKDSGEGTDTELKLYTDQAVLESNRISNGPYGKKYSKVEHNLQAGITYHIKLSNPHESQMKTTLVAESDLDSSRENAIAANWSQIKDDTLSSLYDVDYYKVEATVLDKIQLKPTRNVLTIENNKGEILQTIYPGSSFNVFTPPNKGTYYIKVWSNTSYNTQADFVQKIHELNLQTDPKSILELQKNLAKLKFYSGTLTGVYNEELYMSLIAYKTILNKWDAGVAVSGKFLKEDASIDDRIKYYAKRDVDLGRDAQGSIYDVLFTGDLFILSQAGSFVGDAAFEAIILTKFGSQVTKTTTHLTSKSGTVWDGIKATDPALPGTVIPKSFQLKDVKLGGNLVWIHPNATKHLKEYIVDNEKIAYLQPGLQNIIQQAMLTSFKAAVEKAATKATQPGQNFFKNIDGWEIGITRETGVVYHALKKY
ncbi:chitobiase/beta-hexosaminidase C-terminal domain-containing protein [Bacillus mobilis]|nr:chitobiase/beta-hexosaminidase C-terminal domain-containing protein [Bacillus mobilis]MED0933690.1 chitobiase/beta-hexosaminidase C-terminal domain-containing protein [Bacillus mobilis]MED0954260.1 chitobiase/beta-hexosaminidase C-terminal domain-containing protein [Bacillus mobilis]